MFVVDDVDVKKLICVRCQIVLAVLSVILHNTLMTLYDIAYMNRAETLYHYSCFSGKDREFQVVGLYTV